MKRILVLILSVLFVYYAGAVYAGTLMVGAKGWYTYHDSFMSDYVADRTEEDLVNGGVPDTSSSTEAGNGTLLGGVVGYQTDDQNWSVSFAFMIFSRFSNSIDTNGSSSGFTIADVTYDIEEERRDYDFAIMYSLTDYMKLFAGLKYMSLKYTMDQFVDYNQSLRDPPYNLTIPDDYGDEIVVESTYILPTMGIGFSYPLSPVFIVGLQVGVIYVTGDYSTEYTSGTEDPDSGDFDASYGYNVEAGVTIVFGQKVLLQSSLRRQSFNVKSSDAEGNVDSEDTNTGLTFALIYLISI